MNRILHTVLVFTFVACLSSTYVSMNLWASSYCSSGKDGDHSSHESGGHSIQTKAESKGEKAEAMKDPVCGMEVSDIKKHRQKSTKERFTTFARNTAKRPLKKTRRPIYPRNHHSMVRLKDISINTQI